MSELDTLKNMLIREGAKFVEETEKEINEETGTEWLTTFLCIPALADEFLILGFDEDGSLIYVDAGADWDDYLERVQQLEDVKIY
jgi:hypothetical protein